jgi:hypothetical protein
MTLPAAPATATPAATAGTELLKPNAPQAPVEAAPAAAEPAKEPVAEEKSPSPAEDQKFAARFAYLAKRENALRAKEQAIKEKESKYSAYEAEQKLMDENFLEWASKKGYSFDKLTQMALHDGKKPPELQIKELREELERDKKAREEEGTKKHRETLENNRKTFVDNASRLVEQKKDQFEFLSANESPGELVLEVVQAYYQQTCEYDEDGRVSKPGRILSVEDAASMTEQGLEKEFEEKIWKLDKVQKRVPKEAPKAPEAEAKAEAQGKPSHTLTNSQAATVPTPHTPKILDVEQSKREAAKILKWV